MACIPAMPASAGYIRFYLVSLSARVVIVAVAGWADMPDGSIVRCLQTR